MDCSESATEYHMTSKHCKMIRSTPFQDMRFYLAKPSTNSTYTTVSIIFITNEYSFKFLICINCLWKLFLMIQDKSTFLDYFHYDNVVGIISLHQVLPGDSMIDATTHMSIAVVDPFPHASLGHIILTFVIDHLTRDQCQTTNGMYSKSMFNLKYFEYFKRLHINYI